MAAALGLAAGRVVDSGAAADSAVPMPEPPDLLAVVVRSSGVGGLVVDVTGGTAGASARRAVLVAAANARVWNFVPPGDLHTFEPGDEILAHGSWLNTDTFQATDVVPLFEGLEERIVSVAGKTVTTANGSIVDISAARTSYDTTTAGNRVDPSQTAVGQLLKALVQRNVAGRRRRAYVVAFN